MASRRSFGTGHLYEESGSYYGRWRTLDGRLLNRKVGRVRSPGGAMDSRTAGPSGSFGACRAPRSSSHDRR
jgi:hypothetical protein